MQATVPETSILDRLSSIHLSDEKTSEKSAKIMYIMRGTPGSGKSTLSKEILQRSGNEGVILSTDDFFMQNPEGKYNYEAKQIPAAHKWNQDRSWHNLKKGVNPIIIDNTNTMKWEAKTYVRQARDCGYEVVVTEPETEWWLNRDVHKMAAMNSHHVSSEIIERMLAKWETDFTIENILKSEPPHRGNWRGR